MNQKLQNYVLNGGAIWLRLGNCVFSAECLEHSLQEFPKDIVSFYSTLDIIFKENNLDLDDMSINELIRFIQDNPSVLKRPIIIDERRFQVGYNAEEIRAFIPRELRNLQECMNLDNCPQFKDIKKEMLEECKEGCE